MHVSLILCLIEGMFNKAVYFLLVSVLYGYGTSSHQLFVGPRGPCPPPSYDQASWWDALHQPHSCGVLTAQDACTFNSVSNRRNVQ